MCLRLAYLGCDTRSLISASFSRPLLMNFGLPR